MNHFEKISQIKYDDCYLETNNGIKNKVYQYNVSYDQYYSDPSINEQIKEKAKNINARYIITHYPNSLQVSFYVPISNMTYLKEAILGGIRVVHTNYMTKEMGKEYEEKRNNFLKKQAYQTKIKDQKIIEKFKKNNNKNIASSKNNERNEIREYQRLLKERQSLKFFYTPYEKN